MKKLIATVCLLGVSAALAACGTANGSYVDTQSPYSEERTAGGATQVRSAEPVFERRSTK